MKLKRKYKIIIYILFLLINVLILFIYIGNKYLNRLNKFIYENNRLIVRKEINKFMYNNKFNNLNNIYNIKYNDQHEIISADLNINYINNYLSLYIGEFNKYLNNTLFNTYVNKYFKNLNTNNSKYILVPIGIIYDNPFIFNMGPKIVLSYDFITSITFNVDLKISNYGINNVIVNVYLNLDVEQSTLKPVLDKVTKYKFRFLISSNIVYGKVSNFLGTNITSKSEDITIK